LSAFLVLPSLSSRADDLDSKDFSLRFPAALSRFSSYGDVAGVGGASAGSKWSSSINPASLAWLGIPSRYKTEISPQYSQICFDNGAKLHVTTETLAVDWGDWGVFQPSIAQVWSNTSTTRQGLDFGYEMDYAQMQWAKRISKDWSLGGAFNFTKSKIDLDAGPFDVADSHSESYGFRAGALTRVTDKLLFGTVLDYAFSPGRTTQFDFMHTGMGDVRTEDTTHQFLLRPGVSYEYATDSSINFDYQFGSFFNDTGTLNVNRFYTGMDHRICKWLFARAGTNLDTEGNCAWTTGIGIYPTDWFTIDIGYQHNAFPEVKKEFGNAQLVTLSVGIRF
jgi:hypothetical protein